MFSFHPNLSSLLTEFQFYFECLRTRDKDDFFFRQTFFLVLNVSRVFYFFAIIHRSVRLCIHKISWKINNTCFFNCVDKNLSQRFVQMPMPVPCLFDKQKNLIHYQQAFLLSLSPLPSAEKCSKSSTQLVQQRSRNQKMIPSILFAWRRWQTIKIYSSGSLNLASMYWMLVSLDFPKLEVYNKNCLLFQNVSIFRQCKQQL